MAECSESTGISRPPARRTRSIRAGPQQTRLSLLAKARMAPVSAAAQADFNPAAPTMDAMIQSAGRVAASTMASSPAAAVTPVPARASRRSVSLFGSAVTASFGFQRRACSASLAILAPPVRASTSKAPVPVASACSIRSRVDEPTEPVEPRTVTRRRIKTRPFPAEPPADVPPPPPRPRTSTRPPGPAGRRGRGWCCPRP